MKEERFVEDSAMRIVLRNLPKLTSPGNQEMEADGWALPISQAGVISGGVYLIASIATWTHTPAGQLWQSITGRSGGVLSCPCQWVDVGPGTGG
jgi:hypothetical protein